MPSPWARALNPWPCRSGFLAEDSSHNPDADPRLTTRSEVSARDALAMRVRFAADHPLRVKRFDRSWSHYADDCPASPGR